MSCSEEQLESLDTINGVGYRVLTICFIIFCIVNCFGLRELWMKLKDTSATVSMTHLLRVFIWNNIVSIISYVCPETFQLVFRLFVSGCDALAPVRLCVLARILQSATSVFNQLFSIGIFFDIIFENCWKRYKDYEYSGYINGGLMAAFSCIVVSPSLVKDLSSDELQVECSSLEHKSTSTQFYVFSCLEVLNILLLFVYVSWFIYHRRRRSNVRFRFNVRSQRYLNGIHADLSLTWMNVLLIILAYGYYTGSSIYYAVTDKITAANFLKSNSVPFASMVNVFIWVAQIEKFRSASVIAYQKFEQESRVFFTAHPARVVSTYGCFVRTSSHPAMTPVQ